MKNKTVKKLKKNITFTLFVAPAVILFSVFILYPFLRSILYSLRDWNGISTSSSFIGLDNYTKAFKDTKFLGTVSFTVKYTVILMVLSNFISLLLALALNMPLKIRGALRASFFMPMMMGSITIGYLWNFTIVRIFPIIGKTLSLSAMQKNWFAYPETAFWALIIVSVWHLIGYYMLIYLAGLQSIPTELNESAEIDGATAWKKFCHITFPLLRPSLTICTFLSLLSGLKSFDLNYALTKGGPFGTTQSIAFQIYMDAFDNNQLSYASAKAVILCIAIAAISALQIKLTSGKEIEA